MSAVNGTSAGIGADGAARAVATGGPVDRGAGRLTARRAKAGALATVAALAAVGAGVWYQAARHYESTDDAFVEGRVVPLAAKVDGYVVDLRVDDNRHVSAGDVIAVVDPRDYEAAAAVARGAVASARARLRDAQARRAVCDAQLQQARAAVTSAEAEAEFARLDSERYRKLDERSASIQDRQRADSLDRAARAKVDGARSAAAAAEAAAAESAAAVNVAEADVDVAASQLRQPELNLSYTRVVAPRAGRVARRTVERGSYVKAGQSLLAIVPDEAWVVANFKEGQLADMRPGQPVDIAVDAYPGRTFAGHVDSVQPGTGGRFSLLPPENATGNYVKVVQRVPVKIRFDAPAGDLPLLAPGMSVEPEVRVR